MGHPYPKEIAKRHPVVLLDYRMAKPATFGSLVRDSIASRRGALPLKCPGRATLPHPTDSPNPAKIRPRPQTHTPQILPRNTKAPHRAGLRS